MSSRFPELSRGVPLALAAIVAVALTWRVIVTSVNKLDESTYASGSAVTASPLEAQNPDTALRKRLARNPTDYVSLLLLAMQLEKDGRNAAALEAAAEVLRLAPTDEATLRQTADLYLRLGREGSAIAILRRYIELYPDVAGSVWPVYTAALDSGRYREFFSGAARESPRWFPAFFGFACEKATLAGIQHLFTERVNAGMSTIDERRCIVARFQQEAQWTTAYQLWLNSLPAGQREQKDLLFNGEFESPLSNLGFDWLVSSQDGVKVAAEQSEGANGKRALHVTFYNKRYTTAPLYHYLLLRPGRYRLEGRGRAEGLNTWLGVQWGLYCRTPGGADIRQLTRSDPLLGSSDWTDFQGEFTVTGDCPVQILRLELANPRRDQNSSGNVAVRLRGGVWFDDLRVRNID